MNAEILFLLSTIAIWIGGFCVLKGVVWAVRAVMARIPEIRQQALRSMVVCLGVGGVLMVAGAAIPRDLGRQSAGQGIPVPLVWLAMSIGGWVAFFSLIVIVGRLIQTWMALGWDDRKDKLQSAGLAGVICVLGLWWNHSLEGKVEILRGQVWVTPAAFFGVIALAVAAIFVMGWSEKAMRARGLARKAVTQLTLLAGVFVFGLPFAWLLSTSFKEERDLAMTDGLVWVPKVQVTHDFNDTRRPLALAPYRGTQVKATILNLLPGGSVELEVERPYGLRGRQFEAKESDVKRIPRAADVVDVQYQGQTVRGFVSEELNDGSRRIDILTPENLKGQSFIATPGDTKPVRVDGLRVQNYSEALEWMPLETFYGLTYLKNTLILVIMSVLGTILSCSLVAYGFARLKFPGKEFMFSVMLATMMLPGAVTMMPTFLIFRTLGWFDSLLPLWVPTFFAGAFNVFLLRQFFRTIPMELEDAAKIDGCSYLRTFWTVMLPQIKPALAALAIWTFMGAWNNFMGPLIYVSSPENIPLAYALQLFQTDRGGSFHLMMAFSTMATIPVLLLFFFAQRWFIEGVQLSGLGGR